MVSERMVLLNGVRVPLSTIKRNAELEKGKAPESTVGTIPVDHPDADQGVTGKPVETLKARLDALLEDKDFEKLELELPEFEEIVKKIKKKVDLIEFAEVIGVELPEGMKMPLMKELILSPYQVEAEPDL